MQPRNHPPPASSAYPYLESPCCQYLMAAYGLVIEAALNTAARFLGDI